MDRWNPDSYLKYEHERTLPSRDLVAHIDLSDPHRIVDVGCGPGNSTKILRDRWPNAEIAGLDSSEEMVEKARATFPTCEWILADVESWHPSGKFDVVFSNAALQWMADQQHIIPRLFGCLNDGGVLAVQVPLNTDSPLHKAVIAVSQRTEWCERLLGCDSRLTYHDQSFYYDLLSDLTTRMDLWITTYLHVMDSRQDLIDWYSSTGLKPYLSRIGTEEGRKQFADQVLEVCSGQYPNQRDGKVIFPFRRLFFVAWKA